MKKAGQASRAASAPAYWLYLLRCADGSLYVGVARDVARRLAVHRAGRGSKYVHAHRPFRLVYTERHANRSRAQVREAQIKAWPRARKLALAAGVRRRATAAGGPRPGKVET